MRTEAEILKALETLSKWVCTTQHERNNRQKLQDAFRWVLGEVTIPALDSNVCKKCGSPLSDKSCTDETCPYSDHAQDEEISPA